MVAYVGELIGRNAHVQILMQWCQKVLFHYNLEKKIKSLGLVNEATVLVSKKGINHHSGALVYQWWFEVVHSSAR